MRVEQVHWVEIPAGFPRRGTPADEVASVAGHYTDTGVPVEWYVKEAPARRSTSRRSGSPVHRSRSASGHGFATATGQPVPQKPVDHPVVGVAWEAATACCRWLGERLGLGVRLPTENEPDLEAIGVGFRLAAPAA